MDNAMDPCAQTRMPEPLLQRRGIALRSAGKYAIALPVVKVSTEKK
jgi:hypothetical protein